MLANTSINVVLGMPFLSFNNTDIEFVEQKKLTWRFYITTKVLSTISRVHLINKYEFAKTILDANSKTFVVYMAILEAPTAIPIHLSQIAQIAIL